MIDKKMRNEKGFTFIELLIAMTIGVVVLGTTIYTYTKQDKLLRDENKNIQSRDFARLAMDELGDNLRLAGYGFPPGDSAAGRPALGITVADANTITYLANTDNVSTYVNADSTPGTNNWLLVTDSTGFTAGDNVVFFDAETPTNWNTKAVDTMGPTAFVWVSGAPGRNNNFSGPNGGGGTGIFLPVTDNVAVEVNNYHIITYTFNTGLQTITVTDDMGTDDGGTDDTTTMVANNVSDLTFSYFDADGNLLHPVPMTVPLTAAEQGEVRRIQISITVMNQNDNDITAVLQTDIHLRNMGI